jgi:RNA polymerase sigma factor (sigma-70 family)
MSLRDKSVVVTGGSRGVGLGLVEALVDRGATALAIGAQGRHGDHHAREGSSLSLERPAGGVDQAEFLALVGDLRPELHRYCARLTGSVIDGEDVVQDTLAQAFVALNSLEAAPALRAWLFSIAHNRALDLLRSRAVRAAEPLEAAAETADSEAPDPLEMLMHQEAVKTAISRFVELPTVQRSVVILKDVLEHSLEDIAALLDITVNAVKGQLSRGRSRLKEINAQAPPLPSTAPPRRRLRATSRCSISETGRACARCWRMTSSSINPLIRSASARGMSACSSPSMPAAKQFTWSPHGSRAAKSSLSSRTVPRRSPVISCGCSGAMAGSASSATTAMPATSPSTQS